MTMKKNEIVISVLMAVYNTEFVLVKRAIDSVLAQTYSNVELIILDDGSDNDTHNELMNYAQLHQHKITYLQHENIGQSKSINRGIAHSKGAYITILDADDEYKPNHLVLCMEQMKLYDLIASTTTTVVNEAADYYVTDKHDASKLIHVDDCILFATLFGKKEVFTTLKFEDKYAADAYFYERADEHFMVKKVDLRSYIYYRNNPDSITAKMKVATVERRG
jgi:glycosyltransferase involved in cell wall biosynthesis